MRNLLRSLSREVFAFCKEAAAVGQWSTPDVPDALRFLQQEAAEVQDALIRQQPHYTRNNGRDMHPAHEWADVATLAVIALGPKHDYARTDVQAAWVKGALANKTTEQRLCDLTAYLAGSALCFVTLGQDGNGRAWEHHTLSALVCAALALGDDLLPQVRGRFAQRRLKWPREAGP